MIELLAGLATFDVVVVAVDPGIFCDIEDRVVTLLFELIKIDLETDVGGAEDDTLKF